MSRGHETGDDRFGEDDAPQLTTVSDDEQDVLHNDEKEAPQRTRKVVVVNKFFAESHLGPRAKHPDGTADTKAQLTSLWVLGDPSRPKREPRDLDPPGLHSLGMQPKADDGWCACLPAKCGPCHPDGNCSMHERLGSRGGTADTWGDDSDYYGNGNLCAPAMDECAPFGKIRKQKKHAWSDDDSVDPVSAQILKEQRVTRRPAPEPGAPNEPPPSGCFSGCLGDETWSLDAKGRRVLVKKKGCLFGALGAEDPRTGKRHGNGTCLGGLLVPVTDCIDGALTEETGTRVGGCYGTCLGDEKPSGSGKRRGGLCGEGCLFGFLDYDSDGEFRRQGGCLTGCLYGAEDLRDKNTPKRRTGGCLGLMMGDVDEKTNARRGGCLGCVLGDEDPASPGTRKGGVCVSMGCMLGNLSQDEDGTTRRRTGGCVSCCLGEESENSNARRGGCLRPCVGDEDPETGRRSGGCLAECLFGDHLSPYEIDADGRRHRRRPVPKKGCLQGCDEDSDAAGGSSDDDGEDDYTNKNKSKEKNQRGCLAELLRALCGSSDLSRRRRRRRQRRRREERRVREEKLAAAGDQDDTDPEDFDDDSSELRLGDETDWAVGAWARKPTGYLDVREKVFANHHSIPRIVVDFDRPSITLFSLLGAFFSPAVWKVMNRVSMPVPKVGSKARWSKDKAKEDNAVQQLTKQTLPYLPPVQHEILGAVLGVLFLTHASRLGTTRHNESHEKRNGASQKGAEVFFSRGLFPQFLLAAKQERLRINSRKRAVVRMRWNAELVRRNEESKETWHDVVPMKEETVAVAEEKEEKAGEKREDKKTSWKWPSLALPTLPDLNLSDVSLEWRQQTNPPNNSDVAFDVSIEKALRANMKRHRKKNKGQKLFWAGTERTAGGGDSDSFGVAKPVDDVSLNDDTDRAIGLGLSKMKR